MRLKDERERGKEAALPEETDLDDLLVDAPSRPQSEELGRLLSEGMRGGKGMKGVEAILLVEPSGKVAAVAGEDPGDAMAAAAARFLRDGGADGPLQEVLATTADRYWLAR